MVVAIIVREFGKSYAGYSIESGSKVKILRARSYVRVGNCASHFPIEIEVECVGAAAVGYNY